MSSVSLHSIQLMHIAFDAAARAREDSRRPDALTSDSLVAIVMGAAAAEAFINELAEVIDRSRSDIPARMTAFAAAVNEVESGRGSVTLKYLLASFALTGVVFDKGKSPYQDFDQLIGLRNSLVHLKPTDTRAPKTTEDLEQRR